MKNDYIFKCLVAREWHCLRRLGSVVLLETRGMVVVEEVCTEGGL